MPDRNVCVHVCLYTQFFHAKGFAKTAVKEFYIDKPSGGIEQCIWITLTWTAICSIPALGFLGVF